jgi:hypothetical protein
VDRAGRGAAVERRALDRERDDDDDEAGLLDELSRHYAGLGDEALRTQSLQRLKTLQADLSAQANAAEHAQDAEYSRLLQQYRWPGR